MTVNAEVTRPLVVLPKPILSWNQPYSINIKTDIPLRLPHPRPPLVIMPQVGGGSRGRTRVAAAHTSPLSPW